MNTIEWNESFSVGVDELDQQHQRLFKMLNALFESVDTDSESETAEALVGDMAEYANSHFETEERYMSECEYPHLAAHKEEHEAFRKKVDELTQGGRAGQGEVAREMTEYLYEWLTNHVLFSDKQYAPVVGSGVAGELRKARRC